MITLSRFDDDKYMKQLKAAGEVCVNESLLFGKPLPENYLEED